MLGNITRNVSFGSTGDATKQRLTAEINAEAKEWKLLRWSLQAEARYILPEERVASCLRQVILVAAGVEVLHSLMHKE